MLTFTATAQSLYPLAPKAAYGCHPQSITHLPEQVLIAVNQAVFSAQTGTADWGHSSCHWSRSHGPYHYFGLVHIRLWFFRNRPNHT